MNWGLGVFKKIKFLIIGGIIGFFCGIVIFLAGWDNYGILAIPSGIFTAFYIILSMFFLGQAISVLSFKVLNILAYTITGILSWGIIGTFLSKKSKRYRIVLIIYMIFWIIIGFFATIMVSIAYA